MPDTSVPFHQVLAELPGDRRHRITKAAWADLKLWAKDKAFELHKLPLADRERELEKLQGDIAMPLVDCVQEELASLEAPTAVSAE